MHGVQISLTTIDECGSKRNIKPENSKWKDISLIDEIQKR